MPITIPYPGGKGRLARFIVSQLPKEGRSYVEPFVGRGNLFWAAIGAELRYDRWWLNDTVTIPFFRAIKRAGHTLKVPIRCRAEFERQRQSSLPGDSTAFSWKAVTRIEKLTVQMSEWRFNSNQGAPCRAAYPSSSTSSSSDSGSNFSQIMQSSNRAGSSGSGVSAKHLPTPPT
jgi:hypothetical protein